MRKMKAAIGGLMIAAMLCGPMEVVADDYDLGSGMDFNDEGCGYEESIYCPGMVRLTLGIAVSAALVVGAIVIANNGSSAIHSHS